MMAYAEVTPLTGDSPETEAALGARGTGGRDVFARGLVAAEAPFARGSPFARVAPFVRWTPLVRAEGGTAAIVCVGDYRRSVPTA